MKLSIFTQCTRPEERQDPWRESIANFTDFADEVVIVCGDKSDLELDFPNKDKIKLIYNKWDVDDYLMYGKQCKIGFENTTGEYSIRVDLDYFFHEDDWENIRLCLETTDEDCLFMAKKQFILTDRFRIKSLLPMVFKGSLRGKVVFDSGGDLAQPRINGNIVSDKSKSVCRKEHVIISDNVTDEQIKKRLPDVQKENGQTFCMNRRICIFNYDMTFKTKLVATNEFLKLSKARYKKNKSDWGQNFEEASKYMINMQKGRLDSEGWADFGIDEHPKHIKERIKNIKPEQFGYNAFGNIERNDEKNK